MQEGGGCTGAAVSALLHAPYLIFSSLSGSLCYHPCNVWDAVEKLIKSPLPSGNNLLNKTEKTSFQCNTTAH